MPRYGYDSCCMLVSHCCPWICFALSKAMKIQRGGQHNHPVQLESLALDNSIHVKLVNMDTFKTFLARPVALLAELASTLTLKVHLNALCAREAPCQINEKVLPAIFAIQDIIKMEAETPFVKFVP